MRIRTMCLAIGVGGWCCATSASAAFTGTVNDRKIAGVPSQFFVLNVYACFNSPHDRLLGVGGAFMWTWGGAQLYQNSLGGATAPLTPLIALDPLLAFDSFVTIGKKSTNPGADGTTLDPGAGFWGPGGTLGFSGGWYNSDPDNGQGNPIAQPFGAPGQFYVLIAQVTMQNPSPQWNINGRFSIVWRSPDGQVTWSPGTFSAALSGMTPSPGALGLLAIAGLAPRRRR